MPHYVFTLVGDCNPTVVGAAMDVDEDEARRIAQDITAQRVADQCDYTVVDFEEVPAYTPRPVQVGDVVSGKTAMTLAKGSAIVRVSTADGVEARPAGALLRCPSGYRSGHTDNDSPGGIDEHSRYRVLHLGQPWDPGQRCRS